MGKQKSILAARKATREEAKKLNNEIILRFFAGLEHESRMTKLKICWVILFGSKKVKLKLSRK